jgi:hypothetical protein
MPRTKPTTRKPPSKPTAATLTIDLPGGGRATFRAEHELTPRHVRPLEELAVTMMPLLQRLTPDDGDTADTDGAEVTDDQAGRLSRMNDLAVLAYLKSWTLGDVPAPVDGLLDVPLAAYRAVREKASELHQQYQKGQADRFTVASLDDVDDLDDADPDLPTSA